MYKFWKSEWNTKLGILCDNFEILAKVADDHYYLERKPDNDYHTNRTIQREWRVLSHTLPESIYVQAYEPRFDLLRAVIIGSKGTPYNDGLLFFDIYLPPDYPNCSPEVHSLDPNFNTNEFGNTWIFDEDCRSKIHELLLYIEKHLPNEKPSFNRPGYRRGKNVIGDFKWGRDSTSYHEDAIIYSYTRMLQTIENPPNGFADLVEEHFEERSFSILADIETYLKADVWNDKFETEGSSSSSSSCTQVSAEFKSKLNKVGKELKGAFDKVGADKDADEGTIARIHKCYKPRAFQKSRKYSKRIPFWQYYQAE